MGEPAGDAWRRRQYQEKASGERGVTAQRGRAGASLSRMARMTSFEPRGRVSSMDGARLAVVTGANRGIGREIVSQLRSRGAQVLATAREPVGEELPLDVTHQEDLERLVARLSEGFDILVNNAAVSLEGFDASVARRTLEVNFLGAMKVTDALLPKLRAHGSIVMVSSGMGRLSVLGPELRARFEEPELNRSELLALMDSFLDDVSAGVHRERGWPSNAYSVSKIGLNALTRVLARELAADPRRIKVNAVSPGWVRTRMGGAGAPRSVEEGARTPVWLAFLPETGPTGGFFQDERPLAW